MSRELYITELAESDLAKIWAYIARDSEIEADRFVDKLRTACARLLATPTLGKLKPDFADGIRAWRYGRYYIFYFNTESGIEIARVLHGARDLPRLF
jgi:toxin ParE1/3/4